MNSLHLRLAIFVLRNHQRAIPDEPPNVKKQLSSFAQYCPSVLWNCPRGTTSCLWVRIKRRSIQLALLFPILFPYFLLSSIRIWRAQNLDSYLYHFTHILEHWTCYIARTQSYQSRTNKHVSNNHVHGPLSTNKQQWTLLYACRKYRRFENTHILTTPRFKKAAYRVWQVALSIQAS